MKKYSDVDFGQPSSLDILRGEDERRFSTDFSRFSEQKALAFSFQRSLFRLSDPFFRYWSSLIFLISFKSILSFVSYFALLVSFRFHSSGTSNAPQAESSTNPTPIIQDQPASIELQTSAEVITSAPDAMEGVETTSDDKKKSKKDKKADKEKKKSSEEKKNKKRKIEEVSETKVEEDSTVDGKEDEGEGGKVINESQKAKKIAKKEKREAEKKEKKKEIALKKQEEILEDPFSLQSLEGVFRSQKQEEATTVNGNENGEASTSEIKVDGEVEVDGDEKEKKSKSKSMTLEQILLSLSKSKKKGLDGGLNKNRERFMKNVKVELKTVEAKKGKKKEVLVFV